jgi:hypothetical protein
MLGLSALLKWCPFKTIYKFTYCKASNIHKCFIFAIFSIFAVINQSQFQNTHEYLPLTQQTKLNIKTEYVVNNFVIQLPISTIIVYFAKQMFHFIYFLDVHIKFGKKQFIQTIILFILFYSSQSTCFFIIRSVCFGSLSNAFMSH